MDVQVDVQLSALQRSRRLHKAYGLAQLRNSILGYENDTCVFGQGSVSSIPISVGSKSHDFVVW